MNNISSFIKYHRKKHGFTQEELAVKAGVGIRFIRELEKGKETLQLDKVNHVLSLFGSGLAPTKRHVDAFDIYWNYLNKAIKITLNNKIIKYGILIKEITTENQITAWQFVPNKNAIKYQQKPDSKLIEIIQHSDIKAIEEQ